MVYIQNNPKNRFESINVFIYMYLIINALLIYHTAHNDVNKIIKYIKCFYLYYCDRRLHVTNIQCLERREPNSLRTSAMYTNWSLFLSLHEVY